MSAGTTPIPTGGLCHYCLPKRDGTTSSLHGLCLGYIIPTGGLMVRTGGGLCACECDRATKRRNQKADPNRERLTTWQPSRPTAPQT